MKWVILGLLVLGLVSLAFGRLSSNAGESADEKASSAIYYVIGGALVALAIVIALAHAIVASL